MQTTCEKDIDDLFHKFCPDDETLDHGSLVLFKKEFLTFFHFTQNPDDTLESLQKFILQKINKTSKIMFLELFSQILKETYTQRRPISDCMFFPSKENEAKLIDYLKLATRELQLCIFTLTNNALASTLLYLFEEKKVQIRIITDDANMQHMGSDVETLASKIPVRTDHNLFAHMHNKYVVIDRKLLITGSFNWTGQAVSVNNENVVILEDEDLSLRYLEDFERLWKEFEGNKVTGKGDLDRLRPKEPKKRGRKKKEETEESMKLKEEKLKKKQEKKEMKEKKKLEKQEKKEKKKTDKPEKPKKEKKEKPEKPKKEPKNKEPKEKKVPGAEKKISKREKIPRKAKKNKTRHVPWKIFLLKKEKILEQSKIEKLEGITHANNNSLSHI